MSSFSIRRTRDHTLITSILRTNYLDGLTNNIQEQLDTKLNSVALNDITDWPPGVTSTEIGYLQGITDNIQTQINNAGGGGGLVSDARTDPGLTMYVPVSPVNLNDLFTVRLSMHTGAYSIFGFSFKIFWNQASFELYQVLFSSEDGPWGSVTGSYDPGVSTQSVPELSVYNNGSYSSYAPMVEVNDNNFYPSVIFIATTPDVLDFNTQKSSVFVASLTFRMVSAYTGQNAVWGYSNNIVNQGLQVLDSIVPFPITYTPGLYEVFSNDYNAIAVVDYRYAGRYETYGRLTYQPNLVSEINDIKTQINDLWAAINP